MNMEQLQKENEELRAHVERLRETAIRVCGEYDGPYSASLFNMACEAPSQALNHIKAQVEEETIERCHHYVIDSDNVLHASLTIRDIPRKYSNQPETAAKDGE